MEINGVPYSFDSELKAWGYAFETSIYYEVNKPINFWKAQLALRGYSSRGSNIAALKERLRNANTNSKDPGVLRAYLKAIQAQRAQSQGRKRKASDRLEDNRPAPAARPASRPIAAARSTTAGSARRPDGFVVNRRLAENDPRTFLLGAFFNNEGNDAGYPPLELVGLGAGYRCHLHQEAGSLGLYHETTITNVMIIGSGRNRLGQQRHTEIDAANGWPPRAYVPDIPDESEEEDDEDEEEEEDNGDENPEDDEGWDITGEWEIKCPGMADCFGPSDPYTLTIYSSESRIGKEVYGSFDFGDYYGVIRFSSRQQSHEFIFPLDDKVSADDPTRYYRWRGKETGEDVIQLGSEKNLYKMTFSNGGNRVRGTWGSHDADPGNVTFTGKKIGEGGDYMNIEQKWLQHNQDAYDKANRDRWRR